MLHRLEDLDARRVAQVGALPDVIGLVVTGATEQHGPHLPVSLDSVVAAALRDGIGATLTQPVLATPVIDVAMSDPQTGFAGTITLSGDVYAAIVGAHLSALERCGVRRIAVIDFNAPNMAGSRRAVSEFAAQSEVEVIHQGDLPWLLASLWRDADHPDAATPDHAGRIETSLALALYPPERVGAYDDVVGFTDFDAGDWWGRLLEHGSEHLSPTGVLGIPAGANVAEGRRILAALVADHVAWLTDRLGLGGAI